MYTLLENNKYSTYVNYPHPVPLGNTFGALTNYFGLFTSSTKSRKFNQVMPKTLAFLALCACLPAEGMFFSPSPTETQPACHCTEPGDPLQKVKHVPWRSPEPFPRCFQLVSRDELQPSAGFPKNSFYSQSRNGLLVFSYFSYAASAAQKPRDFLKFYYNSHIPADFSGQFP